MSWEDKEKEISKTLSGYQVDGDNESLWATIKKDIPKKKRSSKGLLILLWSLGFIIGGISSKYFWPTNCSQNNELISANKILNQQLSQIKDSLTALHYALRNAKNSTQKNILIQEGHQDTKLNKILKSKAENQIAQDKSDTQKNIFKSEKLEDIPSQTMNIVKSTLVNLDPISVLYKPLSSVNMPEDPKVQLPINTNLIKPLFKKTFTPFIGVYTGYSINKMSIKHAEKTHVIHLSPASVWLLKAGFKKQINHRWAASGSIVYRGLVNAYKYNLKENTTNVIIDTTDIGLGLNGNVVITKGPVNTSTTIYRNGKIYNRNHNIALELGLSYALIKNQKMDVAINAGLNITAYEYTNGFLPLFDGSYYKIKNSYSPYNSLISFSSGMSFNRRLKSQALELDLNMIFTRSYYFQNQTNYFNQTIIPVVGVRLFY